MFGDLNMEGFEFVANDPYCIAAIGIVIIGGCIALLIDCWQKWK